MSNYLLYYVPTIKKPGRPGELKPFLPDELKQFDLNPNDMCHVMDGPCGLGQGVVFSLLPAGSTVAVDSRYVEKDQKWIAGKGFAVGYWKDKKPGPEELQRPIPCNGYYIELDDGNEWIIPVLYSTDGTNTLPKKLGFTADGSVVESVEEKYRDLCAYAEHYLEFMQGWLGGKQVDSPVIEEQLRMCTEALSINYYVSRAEVTLLELFSTSNLNPTCARMCDLATVMEMIENKDTVEKNSRS